MKLSVKNIEIPTPGPRVEHRGFAWVKVVVELQDEDPPMIPSVEVLVHVPCPDDATFGQARAEGLARSKEVLRAALAALEAHQID